jgi:hypothetical protein
LRQRPREEDELVECSVTEDSISGEEPTVTADEPPGAGHFPAEGDRVTDGEKQKSADAEVHQILHEDVGDVLGSCQTRLDEREAGLHEDHQDRGNQNPYVVEGGLDLGNRFERVRVFGECRDWACECHCRGRTRREQQFESFLSH